MGPLRRTSWRQGPERQVVYFPRVAEIRASFNTDPPIVDPRSSRHPGIASSATNIFNASAASPASSHRRHCGVDDAGNEDGAAARWRILGSDSFVRNVADFGTEMISSLVKKYRSYNNKRCKCEFRTSGSALLCNHLLKYLSVVPAFLTLVFSLACELLCMKLIDLNYTLKMLGGGGVSDSRQHRTQIIRTYIGTISECLHTCRFLPRPS